MIGKKETGERVYGNDIVIKFNTGNAAFDDMEEEMRYVLDQAFNSIYPPQTGATGKLHDSNGNTIGTWSVR